MPSASFQRAERGKMKNENIVRYSLDEIRAMRGKSDWAKVAATTEADIARHIAEDPDLQGFNEIDWSTAVLVDPPKKQAISIRVDNDILAFFKAQGAGYQGRINAVLRHFMDSTRKTG
jgi:uncharacterized protein (DUF4415 family)